jgi:asparagine synthase (glutamine-hydrolysing)
MCGIVGIVRRDAAEPPALDQIERMLGMIRHRGPDQFGAYLDHHAGLGTARLSIIDLAGGQQPIANEDEALWIVFNGEIFNYIELRAELEARGHRFRTRTDTEVVLHAYEESGPECLQRFNGQFAFALWDARRQTLFLARDRLGVRPLFYAQVEGDLVFASEIKALFAEGRLTPELDLLAIEQIFTFWCPLPPKTAFRHVEELPAGHYLILHEGQITLRQYWDLTFPTRNEVSGDPSLEECLDEFRHLLTEAVRVRLRAEVKVGAYLSGGLDSSAVATIMRRLGPTEFDTFSIAFTESEFDERLYQRTMADFLGNDHHEILISPADIGRVFPDVVWHTETPIMRTSPAPMYLLSRLVRRHNYKVVLTGEGADELLGGYDIFKEAMVLRFWSRQPASHRRPALLRRLYPDIPALGNMSPAYLQAFFGMNLNAVADPFFSHATRWRNNRRTHRFFSDDFCRTVGADRRAAVEAPHVPPQFGNWHPLAKAQYLETKIFLSQYLLSSQGDRPAMAHAVEGRFPFLDVRLVEFCSRLPARFKLHGVTEKFLLRQAARDWLPQPILQRPKRPYRAPVYQSFLSKESPDYMSDLLSAQALETTGLFRPRAVAQLVAKIKHGGRVGETDNMALVGIVSTQLLHWLFVQDFRRKLPPPGLEGLELTLVVRPSTPRNRNPQNPGEASPDTPVLRGAKSNGLP